MKETKNLQTQGRQGYVPASVKVIETSVQRVICASDDIYNTDPAEMGEHYVF